MKSEQYSKKIFQSTQEELLAMFKWGQVLQHETRIQILMFLRMNPQLSFSEIVQFVKKSRSTVHHHLQIMIKGGIVREVLETRGKNQKQTFQPKYYELTPQPYPYYSFHNIHELPKENQKDMLLLTTKMHQMSMFFLHQVETVFQAYLDAIEKEILTNKTLSTSDLKRIWFESRLPSSGKISDIPFNELFYFGTQVSDAVYSKYRVELEHFHEKLVEMIRDEQAKGKSVSKPHFIFTLSAPLGRPYQLE